MATNYPGGFDSFTNPTGSDTQDSPPHADQHADANDAIEAIQAELGVDPASSSATVDDRISTVEGIAGTAAQSHDLADVATSGDYGDLLNPVTLANLAGVPTTRKVNNKPLSGDVTLNAGDVGAATTAQGGKANTATQPGDLAAIATSGKWSDLQSTPAYVGAGSSKSAARTAIGAGTGDGTSDLALGTTAGTALEGDTTAEDIDAATNTGGGKEKVAALSATSGTATGNLNNASVFTVTPTGNITLAFSNIPTTGTACTLTVIISMGSTLYTVTMPSGTVWLSGAPTLVASKTAVFTMLTVDGGTTWIASAGVEA